MAHGLGGVLMDVDFCNGKEDRHYWQSEIMLAGNRSWGWCSLAGLHWCHQSESSSLCIFTVLSCMKKKSDVCFYYEHSNGKAKSKCWMYKFQPCKLLLCMQGWCLRQFLGVEILNPLGAACSCRTIKIVELIDTVSCWIHSCWYDLKQLLVSKSYKDCDWSLTFYRHLGFCGLAYKFVF